MGEREVSMSKRCIFGLTVGCMVEVAYPIQVFCWCVWWIRRMKVGKEKGR